MNKTDFTEKSKKHFDAIAAVYPNSWDGRFCEPGYLPLVYELKNYASGKWLDVSCGTGTLLRFANNGDYHMYGRNEIKKLLCQHSFQMQEYTRIDKHIFFCKSIAI